MKPATGNHLGDPDVPVVFLKCPTNDRQKGVDWIKLAQDRLLW